MNLKLSKLPKKQTYTIFYIFPEYYIYYFYLRFLIYGRKLIIWILGGWTKQGTGGRRRRRWGGNGEQESVGSNGKNF